MVPRPTKSTLVIRKPFENEVLPSGDRNEMGQHLVPDELMHQERRRFRRKCNPSDAFVRHANWWAVEGQTLTIVSPNPAVMPR